MSLEIDEHLVSMGFDNSNFEKNVGQSLGTIDKLKSSLDFTGAVKGLNNIGNSISSSALNGLASGVDQVANRFSTLGIIAMTTLENITNRVVNASMNIANMFTLEPINTGFKEYETYIDSTQTILANTKAAFTEAGKSEEEQLKAVNEKLNELNHYADKTIYNFTQMTQNIGRFTAAGVDLDTSVTAIQGIANLAAVSGSTSQQASTAMYQLSQALASGTVKLQDWNSVVNASMGGKVFQDALKETARVFGTGVDEAIEKTGTFRESLKEGWLTTEVLTETLEHFTYDLSDMTDSEIEAAKASLKAKGFTDQQIKSIFELGQSASDAATKVKTFTQLMDTLKEAAQSGWTQTWQYVIGDFNQAKTLWTEVSDYFGDIIGQSADARNAIFKIWAEQGGRDDAIKGIKNIWRYFGSIVKPIKEAWEIIFPKWPNDWLKNFSKNFYSFTRTLKITKSTSENIKNVAQGLFSVLKIGLKIVESLFNGIKTGLNGTNVKMISDWAGYINKFVEATSNALKNSEFFEKVTNNTIVVVSLLKTSVIKAIDAIGMAFSKGDSVVKSFKNGFLNAIKELVVGILEIFLAFSDTEKSTVFLNNAIENVRKGFDSFSEFLDKTWEKLKYFKISDTVKKWTSSVPFLNIITDAFNSFFETIKKIVTIDTSNITGFFEKFKAKLEPLSFVAVAFKKALGGILTAVKTVGSRLVQMFKELGNQMSEGLEDLNFDKIFKMIETLVGGLSLAGLGHFAASIGDLFSFIGDIKNDAKVLTKTFSASLSVLTEQIKDFLGDFVDVERLKATAEMLKSLAIAIGVLSVSIILLSAIDSDKALASTGLIVTMMIGIAKAAEILVKATSGTAAMLTSSTAGVTGFFNKLGALGQTLTGAFGQAAQLKALASLMTSIAVAVGILAASLFVLSFISYKDLIMPLISIIGIMVSLVIVAKQLSTMQESNMVVLGKVATSILLLAVSIGIIASAIKKLSGIDNIIQGIIGFGAILGGLWAFIELTKRAFGPEVIKIASGVLILSIAIGIIANAVKKMSKISNLTSGLAGFGVILIGIYAFMAAMQATGVKSSIGISVSLLIMANAILILSGALTVISKIDFLSLVGSIGALIVLLFSLAVVAVTVQSAIGGALAIAVMASSLIILAVALKLLGSMSWSEILTSLGVLALSLVGLGVAALLLSPLVPALLGVAGAIALMGVGAALAGVALITIATGLGMLVGVILSAGTTVTAIIMEFLTLIPFFFKAVGEGIVQLITAIGNSAAAICEAVVAVGLALCDAVIQLAPAIVEAILTVIDALLEALADHAPNIVESIIKIVLGILKGLYNAICDFFGIHSPSTVMADIGKYLIEGLAIGLDNIVNPIKSIKNLASSIISSMKDKWSEFKENGKNWANGIAEGIKSKVSYVVEQAKNLGKRALDNLKDFLGIHSPSRVFAEVGKFVDEGFANGLTKNIGTITRASNSVGNSAKDSLSEALSGINDEFGIDELNPTITPVLDLSQIKTGANNIASLLNSDESFKMGVNSNFEFNKNRSIARDIQADSIYNDTNLLNAVNRLYSNVKEIGEKLTNMQVVLDSGSIVGGIASNMDTALGTRSMRAIRERV